MSSETSARKRTSFEEAKDIALNVADEDGRRGRRTEVIHFFVKIVEILFREANENDFVGIVTERQESQVVVRSGLRSRVFFSCLARTVKRAYLAAKTSFLFD
jgi:hypothetical protein